MIYGKYKTNDNKIILRGAIFSIAFNFSLFRKQNAEVLGYILISLMLGHSLNCTLKKEIIED